MTSEYSIIIPTKDEEEGIAKVLCSIPNNIRRRSEVFVIDSSKDMTPVIAKKLGVKVIKSRGSKGKAMKTGVELSKGKILIFLDGDGTDPASYIPKLLEKLKNANLVLGCRAMKEFSEDDPMMRRIFHAYGLSIRPVFRIIGLNVADPLAGFRVIRREDWDKLKLQSNGFEIEAEMNVKALENNFVIKQVPIPHLKRSGGLTRSKLVMNPRHWIKVANFVLKHIHDKKLKSKIKYIKDTFKI